MSRCHIQCHIRNAEYWGVLRSGEPHGVPEVDKVINSHALRGSREAARRLAGLYRKLEPLEKFTVARVRIGMVWVVP